MNKYDFIKMKAIYHPDKKKGAMAVEYGVSRPTFTALIKFHEELLQHIENEVKERLENGINSQ